MRYSIKPLYPNKARNGKDNGNFKHGGYCNNFLDDKEEDQFDRDYERYMNAYKYLRNDPVAQDMLTEALYIKIRIQRLNKMVLDTSINLKSRLAAEKLLDALQRTFALYFDRLMITPKSKAKRKEPKRIKTPLEMLGGYENANKTDLQTNNQ